MISYTYHYEILMYDDQHNIGTIRQAFVEIFVVRSRGSSKKTPGEKRLYPPTQQCLAM